MVLVYIMIYMYVWVYVCICMCVYVCVCMYVYMCVCMYMYMCIGVYVCMCVYVYMYVHYHNIIYFFVLFVHFAQYYYALMLLGKIIRGHIHCKVSCSHCLNKHVYPKIYIPFIVRIFKPFLIQFKCVCIL